MLCTLDDKGIPVLDDFPLLSIPFVGKPPRDRSQAKMGDLKGNSCRTGYVFIKDFFCESNMFLFYFLSS